MTRVRGLNNAETLVAVFLADSTGDVWRSFVWSGGDFAELVLPLPNLTDLLIEDINDDGVIVGQFWGIDNGESFVRGFVATPVPEPATVLLLALGGLALLRRRK